MIRVKFNDNDNIMDTAEFSFSSDSVVLTGKDIKANESGFKVYRMNGTLLGDYSEYKKIIKKENGYIQFGKLNRKA